MNVNKVVLVGRLTRDPELRLAEGDLPCANFTVATNRRYKRRDGTTVDEATFVDCAMFGPRAKAFVEFHRQGDHACVSDGRLQTTRWTDRETGEERSKLRVVVEDWEFVDAGRQRREA